MNLKSESEKSCHCLSSEGLFLPNRQISFVVAGMLSLFFLTFISGYFLGKKHAVEHFANKLDQDSFSDQIYSSLCALYDQPDVVEDSAQNFENDLQEQSESASLVDCQEISDSTKHEDKSVSSQYYAQLIGFGTARAANRFAQKLQKKGLPVYVKERNSRTAKGKKIAWYQVVTEKYSDKTSLQDLVDRISKEETLKGIHIASC